MNNVDIMGGWLPYSVYALAFLLVVIALLGRGKRRWLFITIAAALLGAGIGIALIPFVQSPIGLDTVLDPIALTWMCGGFALVAAMVVALVRGKAKRRVLAAFAIPLVLLSAALGVNAQFGQYPTLGSLVDAPISGKMPESVIASQHRLAPTAGTTNAAAGADAKSMPTQGLVSRVQIPATVSKFPARDAYVYLPPAALGSHPERMPVMIMLSGQPGAPENVVQAGSLREIMDAWAAKDHGRAPIVVVPDQLGDPASNPMCVDSKLGNSATYLTVDVPKWIESNLGVLRGPENWAIGGFSQGGTCAIQLGSAHPEIFSAILDVSGQVEPANGSQAHTIKVGFDGSTTAYEAALPLNLLKKNAPYRDTVAVFGSGSLDGVYGPRVNTVSEAARNAGMDVTRVVSPNTAHSWQTVQWVMRNSLEPILTHLHVGPEQSASEQSTPEQP
ncbi:hypothetical protein G7068_10720 [Leucobacter viscericola]|uniref:S-formylglutathione hydrolase FrmB n=1 Tax=Leucobacter viscericola TaxID=2714935 RepID=A0A6G7XGE1_9MICO|nr:alpha/beta hydrolase-fold protein [Leucobacter viscericola]QIK63613.1 hypothetical protein G7068_10720 [Leucobacter viscericola]